MICDVEENSTEFRIISNFRLLLPSPAQAVPVLSAECLGQVLLMAISAVRTDASQGFPLTVREALESHFKFALKTPLLLNAVSRSQSEHPQHLQISSWILVVSSCLLFISIYISL